MSECEIVQARGGLVFNNCLMLTFSLHVSRFPFSFAPCQMSTFCEAKVVHIKDAFGPTLYWDWLESGKLIRVHRVWWDQYSGQLEVEYEIHDWRSKPIEEWRRLSKTALPQLVERARKWKNETRKTYYETINALIERLKSEEARKHWDLWLQSLVVYIDDSLEHDSKHPARNGKLRIYVQEEVLLFEAFEQISVQILLQR